MENCVLDCLNGICRLWIFSWEIILCALWGGLKVLFCGTAYEEDYQYPHGPW
jgi:hypothetical protein